MKRINTQKTTPNSRAKLGPSVDLDEIFTGGTFQLDKGDDFECAASTAAQLIRNAYRQRFGHLKIKETPDKTALIIEFVPGRQ